MKCDVSLDKTTYVGIVGKDEEEIKQKVRKIASLSDYGVSKLVLTRRKDDKPFEQ